MESSPAGRNRPRPAHAAAWAVAEAITGALFSTATYLVMTWWVPAEEIGLALLALALAQIASSLVEFIFSDYVIATPALDRRKLGELNAANIVLGMAMAALLGLLAPLLEGLLPAPGLAQGLWLLAGMVVCSGISAIPLACLKRDLAFDLLARRTIVVRILSCGLGLGLAWLGFGFYAIVAQQMMLSLANVTILLTLTRLPLAHPRAGGVVARAFRFSGANLLPNFMAGNVNRLLVFAVGFMASPAEIAFVGMATRIVDALTFPILGGLGQVTLPILSRARAQGYVLADTYRKAASLTSIVAIPSFVGLAICSPLLTQMILAPHWNGVAVFISLLAIERAIRISAALNGPLVTILGHAPANLRLSLVDNGLGLILMMALGQFGVIAGMIGWSLKSVVYLPLSWRMARKFAGMSFHQQWAASASALIAAAVMAGACLLAGPSVATRVKDLPIQALLAVQILVGVGAYMAVLHLIDRSLFGSILAQFRARPAKQEPPAPTG